MTLDDAQTFVVWLAKCAIAGLIIMGLIRLPMTDDSDRSFIERSGLKPRIDHRTGCQYLESRAGHLIPRLDGQGQQVGCWRGTEWSEEQ